MIPAATEPVCPALAASGERAKSCLEGSRIGIIVVVVVVVAARTLVFCPALEDFFSVTSLACLLYFTCRDEEQGKKKVEVDNASDVMFSSFPRMTE